jgi:uncharacterized protein (DUF2236 family)
MSQAVEAPHVTAAPEPAEAAVTRSELEERFRWYLASLVRALFAGALFDQVLRPEIAASLEVTGRIRTAPGPRGARSAASEQLVMWGDDADRRAETDRLVHLHRDVRGTDPSGVRYSALAPESWNWILISSFFWLRNSYAAVTGEDLSPADNQTLWEFVMDEMGTLRRSGLPASYDEMLEHYESVLRDEAEGCELLDRVVAELRRPSPPPSLPSPLRSLWRLAAPALGHVPSVLSFGIMHPLVRTHARIRWTPAHTLEFAVLTRLIGLAYQRLPRRVHYSPLAYNRWRYEQLTARYKAMGLDSFRPDATGGPPSASMPV